MKRTCISLLILAVSLVGCAQPMNKTQQGAWIGTGVGAAAGAGLGQAIGGDTEGTLIGAGIGALLGGLAGGGVGRYMDNQEQALRQQLAASEAASIQRNADTLALTFKSDVLFDVGSASLKPGAYDEIFRVGQVLNQYPQTSIMVAGHTDSTGSEALNQQLSERRSSAVRNALIKKNVDPRRVETVGFGEAQPVADNSTENGRQLNRRVQVTITPRA